jgi:GTP-sensing pleiotropic transcriptional regulator CodY
MPEIATYDKIKVILDANLAVLTTKIEAQGDVLTTQMEKNRDVFSVKFSELKKDIEEIKQHAKETNGNVKKNSDSILLLEEKQCQESKRRRKMWGLSLAAITTMFGTMLTYIVYTFSR